MSNNSKCSSASISRISSMSSIATAVDFEKIMEGLELVARKNVVESKENSLSSIKPAEYRIVAQDGEVSAFPNDLGINVEREKTFEHTFLLVKNEDSSYSFIVNIVGNGLATYMATDNDRLSTVLDVLGSPKCEAVKFFLSPVSSYANGKHVAAIISKVANKVLYSHGSHIMLDESKQESNDEELILSPKRHFSFVPVKPGKSLGRFLFAIYSDRHWYYTDQSYKQEKDNAVIFELLMNDDEDKITYSLRDARSIKGSDRFLAVDDNLKLKIFDPSEFRHTLFSRRKFQLVHKSGLKHKIVLAMRSVALKKYLVCRVDTFTADTLDHATAVVLEPV